MTAIDFTSMRFDLVTASTSHDKFYSRALNYIVKCWQINCYRVYALQVLLLLLKEQRKLRFWFKKTPGKKPKTKTWEKNTDKFVRDLITPDNFPKGSFCGRLHRIQAARPRTPSTYIL